MKGLALSLMCEWSGISSGLYVSYLTRVLGQSNVQRYGIRILQVMFAG
jgi:hypothetical protein